MIYRLDFQFFVGIYLHDFNIFPGGIHAQIATLNVNMTLGGKGFVDLMLHVWQNDIFPKFVISFLN